MDLAAQRLIGAPAFVYKCT